MKLLEDASATEPSLERALGAEHDKLFVKNLESVQGDERDVMLSQSVMALTRTVR